MNSHFEENKNSSSRAIKALDKRSVKNSILFGNCRASMINTSLDDRRLAYTLPQYLLSPTCLDLSDDYFPLVQVVCS